MDRELLQHTLALIADFYDGCKVGCEGFEGYRKSADLAKLGRCIDELVIRGFINPGHTIFADLGCADGRVNVLMSYFVRRSIGIEIDPDILAEFTPRLADLSHRLQEGNLLLPPDIISLFEGDSLDKATYGRIYSHIGVRFPDIDLFYTYITLHDLFAEKIVREAKGGALYMVYGFNRILPRYRGLEVLIPDVGSQGIVALYGKLE